MSSEIHLAFAHPSERAASGADDGFLDRISLRDHIVDVEIGAFQAERGTTQRISFNIVVEVRLPDGNIDDDVDRILSYDRVTEAISYELAAERLNLLETLAERVAERILLEPQAMRTFVRIEKLDRGSGALGVEIMRARGAGNDPVAHVAEEAPHPRVVFLSNPAIQSERLSEWLDWLEADASPAIVCVGTPDNPAPASVHPLARRRIDLLAIEQNAWVLAARDPRCIVVSTRTELDWAMKNGQISVWAPSKIVLDLAEGDSSPTEDIDLAGWFSVQLEAFEFLTIGSDVPDGIKLPVRSIDLDQALI